MRRRPGPWRRRRPACCAGRRAQPSVGTARAGEHGLGSFELGQGRVEIRAHSGDGLFAPVEHFCLEYTTSILGDEHQVDLQVVDVASTSPKNRPWFPPGCRKPPLRWVPRGSAWPAGVEPWLGTTPGMGAVEESDLGFNAQAAAGCRPQGAAMACWRFVDGPAADTARARPRGGSGASMAPTGTHILVDNEPSKVPRIERWPPAVAACPDQRLCRRCLLLPSAP